MARDTRQLILDVSQDLFNKQGYTGTSMRQIAAACGITIGNLCYYFGKKEDLLMAYHNKLSDAFLNQLPEELTELDPWCSYIAAEYCFLYQCASEPVIRKLFLDVINVPTLRVSYTDVHHEIFLKFLSNKFKKADARHLYLTTVSTVAVQYHMMEQYDALSPEIDFDSIFSYVFETRMALLNISAKQRHEKIENGFELGKRIFDKAKIR